MHKYLKVQLRHVSVVVKNRPLAYHKKKKKKQKKEKPGKSKAKNTQKPKEETTKRTRSQGKPY